MKVECDEGGKECDEGGMSLAIVALKWEIGLRRMLLDLVDKILVFLIR